MSVKSVIYLTLTILGLVVPWYYNLQFFQTAGLMDFANESSANLAATSVSFDLFIATVAASFWMFFESKRVGIKFGLLYIFLGFFVAFSFAMPLFLFVRERKLEAASEGED